jgi:hypothetical protein
VLSIVRRSSGSVVTWRRAQMLLLSAQAMEVPVIAKGAFISEARVREVIHNFNDDGFDSLYPKYSGGQHPVVVAGGDDDGPLIVGPVLLVTAMSGTPLVATTGIAAGALLLSTATAGFHDLASGRPLARSDRPVKGRISRDHVACCRGRAVGRRSPRGMTQT